LSSASLGMGNTLTVSGSQFTLNGKVNMRIYPASGNGIILDSVVFSEYNGTVRMDYALPPLLLKGDYIVSATDANTGRNTDARRFFVNGLVPDNTGSISVQTPAAGQKYMLGNSIIVLWRDKADYGYLIPGTGAINIRYKIEVQKDNGAWQTVKDTTVKGYKDQFSTFAYVYRPLAVGSYAFRVTNQETLNRVGVSGTGIVENQQGGVNVQFVWDYTVPDRENKNVVSPPIGVAADGTARFYIKVSPNQGNTKTISNVLVNLKNAVGTGNTPDKIGKVMWSRGIYGYGLEGNDAKLTSATSGGASDNEGGHWFWYVAPDDFARGEIDHYSGSRKVIASIVVTYNDNSKEPLIEREIEVVRPPLMMVHGLGGSPEAWDEFSYLDKFGNAKKFIESPKGDLVFKVARAVRIDPAGAFRDNARLLLNMAPNTTNFSSGLNANSIQSNLFYHHKNQIASNRVDYVAHSMGGNVGRTVVDFYSSDYFTKTSGSYFYKNYQKGFYNKYITIQTPHNGSPFANFLDKYQKWGVFDLLIINQSAIIQSSLAFTGKKFLGVEQVDISEAIRDLRFSKGYNFKSTPVKNHLIGTQLYQARLGGDDWVEKSMNVLKNSHEMLGYTTLVFTVPFLSGIEKDFMTNSNERPFFLPNSDLVVGITSQLSNKNNHYDDWAYTQLYGAKYTHLNSRERIEIGNKVFNLLNSPINEAQFSSNIPASSTNVLPDEVNLLNNTNDSIKLIHDTTKIRIVSPQSNFEIRADSLINVMLEVRDTINLIETFISYQGKTYFSNSKIKIQNFNFQANPLHPGNSLIIANGIYDSSEYLIRCIDTCSTIYVNESEISGFKVLPRILNIDLGKKSIPSIYHETESQNVLVPNTDDSISTTIFENRIVEIDSIGNILAKDTGSTQILYKYKGFTDTLFVIVESLENYGITSHPSNSISCPQSDIFFDAKGIQGSTYQWQLDSGNGYANLTNNGLYKGVSKDTLWLNQPPTSMAGYRYRCLVTNSKGSTYTLPAFLRFSTTWTGTADSAWENAGNWSCGRVPDEFTDVIIPEKTNVPKVNSDVKCRSLVVSPGANIQIQPGRKLEVNGKDWDFQY